MLKAIKNNDPIAPLPLSVTKVYCGDNDKLITNHGIQVHGGIGFTWDHDMHLYFKRSCSNDTAFGDAIYHREQIKGNTTIDIEYIYKGAFNTVIKAAKKAGKPAGVYAAYLKTSNGHMRFSATMVPDILGGYSYATRRIKGF